jgi:hypothetical protein
MSDYIKELTEQRIELLDALDDVLAQACLTDDGTLDSMALSAYADGLHLLAEHGRVVIIQQNGRRVIAKQSGTIHCQHCKDDPPKGHACPACGQRGAQ